MRKRVCVSCGRPMKFLNLYNKCFYCDPYSYNRKFHKKPKNKKKESSLNPYEI